MRPLVSLEKQGKEWVVVTRSNRRIYASTCYAKAVGVHEYLEQRRAEMEAETRACREKLRKAYSPA
jgi:hypothetical protein